MLVYPRPGHKRAEVLPNVGYPDKAFRILIDIFPRAYSAIAENWCYRPVAVFSIAKKRSFKSSFIRAFEFAGWVINPAHVERQLLGL
jgi:hypothetical protein